MPYTLVICEKPQAAMKIAYALAEIAPVKRAISGVPYWEVNRGKKKFIIASAVGHVFGLVQKKESREWPVFDIEWKALGGFVKKYINVLAHFAKEASDFIIACDYDVEGELIGFNVLRFICKKEDAKRMKFSALTKPDLIKSYENILPHVDFGQAYAGETRHFLDWFYGINLSRALMQAIKKAGAFKILSIGRVQGPALALVVEREKQIQKFKPEPYWQVFLLVKNEHELEVKYPKDIFKEKELKVFKKLKGKKGEAKTTKEEKNMRPWPPFDLTTLQMEAYKFFGFSPAQTLAITQKLYLQGLISYPRTSSQKLPTTIGYRRILNKLDRLFPKLTVYAKRAKPIEGRKTDPAHPSIFPTGEAPKKLTRPESHIYSLIVKRFLACFAEDALIEEKKVSIKVDKYEFIVQGKKILKRGWLNIYPTRIDEKIIPELDSKIKVKDVRIEEKETQPPKRYSPSSIVSELEKRGLGTKGTRAMIIDTLYKRGYVIGRQIQATKLGMSVALALEKNCPLILDEKLTRKFEEEMEKIRVGKTKQTIKKKGKKVIDEARKLLIEISEQFKKHENEIGKELLAAHKEIVMERKRTSMLCLCPVCKKGYLMAIRSRKGKRFAGCDQYPKCKATFPLPQYGLIKTTEKKCLGCDFPLLLLIRKGMPPWEFCFNPECKTRKAKEKTKKIKKIRKKRKSK